MNMFKRIKSHHRFMWDYTRDLMVSFLRPATFFLTGLTFTGMGLGSLVFYLIEDAANTRLNSYLDALYFTVATMTSVGYGDIAPITDAGKVVAIFMMIAGTAIYVSFTAIIATSMIEIEAQKRN